MEGETTPNISSMSDERPDPDSLIPGADVEQLSQILAGKTEPPTKPPN
jgi:hypothetical protein